MAYQYQKPAPNSNMRQKGQAQELLARQYLEQHQLSFVTANFQCRCGEIDLIMRDQNTLVFVEVRFRHRSNFGNGAESITKRKQQRIIRSAQYYLQLKYNNYPQCRFDVITIGSDQQQKIEWIKDAFWVQY